MLIDPIRTRTADLCDLHYQPTPGSDGYLAAAIGKILLEEGLVDRDFIENHTEGFQAYLAALDGFSLEWLASQCAIPLEDIRKLALMYGTTKPASIWAGWGVQRREYGAEIYRLMDALAAITGNIGVPGGGVSHGMEEREYWDWSLKAPEAARVHRGIPKAKLGEGILDAKDPPVKMIVVTCANPATQAPHSLKVRESFRSREFVVVLDSFITDTADLALSSCRSPRPSGRMTWWELRPPVVGAGEPGDRALGEARTDLQIFQGLAGGWASRVWRDGHRVASAACCAVRTPGDYPGDVEGGAVAASHPAFGAIPGSHLPHPSGRFRFTADATQPSH